MLDCESGVAGEQSRMNNWGRMRHLRDESRSDETGRGSAMKSACARVSAKMDAEPRSGSKFRNG